MIQYLRDLDDPVDKIREEAAQKLGEIGDPMSNKQLIKALEDEDVEVRFYVSHALGELKAEAAVGPLIKRLKGDSDPDVRAISALSLGKIELPDAIGPLIDALRVNDRFIREAAVNAVGYLRVKESVVALVNLMRSDSISNV